MNCEKPAEAFIKINIAILKHISDVSILFTSINKIAFRPGFDRVENF